MRYLALLPLICLTGCIDGDFAGMIDRYKDDFHYSFALNPGATVELDNANGSVEITGWDQDNIEITGTKYASSEERLHDVKIDISNSPSSISIRTIVPHDGFGNAGAKYVIRVPRKVELRNISSSNGAIHVTEIEGETHLKTSNGSIHATAVKGLLDARTTNGAMDATDVTGDTILRSSNGAIHADVRKGGLDATTSNGTITAHLADSGSHPVHVASSNGHIDLTLDSPSEVRANTSNSSITVHLPESAGADLRAHTTNGSITTDFEVTSHGIREKHTLEGSIGAGGPLMELGTTNGSIRVSRL